LGEIQKQTCSPKALQKRYLELQGKAKRITRAIAEAGHSPSLLAELQTIESEIEHIDRQVATSKPMDVNMVLAEARKFVTGRLMNPRTFLRATSETAKPLIMPY